MTDAEFTLLVIWLSGIAITIVIGTYQFVIHQDNLRYMQETNLHQVIWLLGSLIWPLYGFILFLVAMHKEAEKFRE